MKRKVILIATGLLLAAAAWVLVENRPTSGGPMYQGKTARQWLGEIYTRSQAQAMAAFREMGTNAFPILIQELRKKDSPLDKMNRWIYPRLPAAVRSRWSRPLTPAEQEQRWSAVELILINVRGGRQVVPELAQILEDRKCGSRQYTLTLLAQFAGPQDTECVPALVDGLAEKDFALRYQVFHGLITIGPGAKAAVPTLKNLASDPNIDTRALAALALWKIDGQTNLAVTALREAMGATNYSYMKGWAPVYLHQINSRDETLIPSFVERLGATNSGTCLAAISILGTYGPAAATAVPALTNLLQSQNQEIRGRAMLALKRIDPETAAKYETK